MQDGISLLHPVSSPEYSYTVNLYRSMGPLFEDSEKLVVAGDLGKKVRIQSASNEFTIFFPSRILQVECNSLKPRSRQPLVQRQSVFPSAFMLPKPQAISWWLQWLQRLQCKQKLQGPNTGGDSLSQQSWKSRRMWGNLSVLLPFGPNSDVVPEGCRRVG